MAFILLKICFVLDEYMVVVLTCSYIRMCKLKMTHAGAASILGADSLVRFQHGIGVLARRKPCQIPKKFGPRD